MVSVVVSVFCDDLPIVSNTDRTTINKQIGASTLVMSEHR